MKSIGFLLLISVTAFGQRAAVGRPAGVARSANTFSSASGFGNVVFPGTGHAPSLNRPPIGGVGAFPGRIRSGSSVIYVPYSVGFPTYYGAPVDPYAAGGAYPPQQFGPQVVINQSFAPEVARPVVREYVSDADGGIRVYEPATAPSAAAQPPAPENPTYLIAFKDHTIYAAVAYWVEGDTLHYVTNQNTHNQVSLDLVDRDLSNRLNRERNVDFRLPSAR